MYTRSCVNAPPPDTIIKQCNPALCCKPLYYWPIWMHSKPSKFWVGSTDVKFMHKTDRTAAFFIIIKSQNRKDFRLFIESLILFSSMIGSFADMLIFDTWQHLHGSSRMLSKKLHVFLDCEWDKNRRKTGGKLVLSIWVLWHAASLQSVSWSYWFY